MWDWKSGESAGDPAESLQLGFCAYCACKLTGRRQASVAYKYLRDTRVTTSAADIGIDGLRRVRTRLERIRALGTQPRVGAHCGDLWCPARHVCPELIGKPRKDSEKEKSMPRMTLASIKRGVVETPLSVVLYGPEKVGKSTFAAGAPSPIFLSGKDSEGTAHLDVSRFPEAESWGDIQDAVAFMGTSDASEFQTLVIDTADWIEPLAWEKVCKDGGKQQIDDFGYGKGYNNARELWRGLTNSLDDLRRQHGKHIVVLAHSQVRTFNNPAGDDFDRYELKLNGKTASVLKEWPSALMFANYETYTSEKDGKVLGVGTGSRIVHTEHRAAWDAGNRYGLPETLPLDWSEFQSAVKAGKPSSAEKLQAECSELLKVLDDATKGKALGALERAADDASKLAKVADWMRGKANAA